MKSSKRKAEYSFRSRQTGPMSAPPQVSVVMSVYNGRPFLETAVESILDQTFADFEFIIIDDGSSDGSTALLREYAEQDERIRLFEQQNVGVTASLNRGLREVRGEYIARMDADDVCHPERLEKQVAYLGRHPNCVAVGGQALLINEEGEPIRCSGASPGSDGRGRMKGLKQDHRSIENELLDGGWPLLQPAVTMRREAVEDVGGYDERFEQNQDHDLFLKLAEVGRLSNLSSTVLKYRRHSEQATAQQSGRNFAAKYRKAKIRREAYLRRCHPLPDELRLTSLVGLLLRRGLSKTAMWPYVQRAWSALRRTG